MRPDPLVTVLMAVYNGGDYLHSSVRSVLNQTYRDYEFLIINDCSTDNSVEIINSFNDSRIVIHNNEKNIGQTMSLNVGLKLARGKYIARMDADDIAFPLWLERMVDFVKRNPGYDVVGAGAVAIDAGDKITQALIWPDSDDVIRFAIFFETPFSHVGCLMDKGSILNLGGYNESFKITQDYELWSHIIRKNRKLTSIPDILMALRLHEQSVGFIAANDRGTKEHAQTIFENIRSMSNLVVTFDDAVNLRRLFRKSSGLSYEEFYKTINIFAEIYKNLKFEIDPVVLENYLRAQIIKAYCIHAMDEISSLNKLRGREVARRCLTEYGFHIMPFAIYVSSYGGKKAVQLLFKLYKKYIKVKAIRLLHTNNLSISMLK